MPRALLALPLLLAFPLAARAQTWSYAARAEGYPAGLALPGASVAGGEEPAAVAVNPAAAGFNEGLTLQYFHERETRVRVADGLYLGAGPLSLTSEWVRPTGQASYRKLGLGLGLGGRGGAFGITWNDWTSGDRGIGGLRTWDVGATVRPARWLSLGAAALDLDGRLRDAWLPIRYRLGAAVRLADDSLTLGADWLADDDGDRTFRSRALAFSAAWESRSGVALGGQVQVPTRRSGETYLLATLGFNTARAGASASLGRTRAGDPEASTVGLRISTRGYRGMALSARPITVDLAAELDPPSRFPFRSARDPHGALLAKLRQLREDPEVGAVLLRVSGLALGAARAEELRGAVEELGQRKRVVAYLEDGGLEEYLVASAASRIEMAPLATLRLTGYATGGLYLKEALARLGIAVEVIAIGKYKSAGEALGAGGMSEADREQREALLEDLFARRVKTLAEARRLAPEKVRELVDQGLFDAEGARRAGLVDEVAFPDELEKRLGLSRRSERSWEAPAPRAAQRWGSRPAVAVVQVSGMIVPGRSRSFLVPGGLSGADTVVELLHRAAADRAVRAIVVRIDSPGGDALASDLIRRAMVEARQKGKPVVVSMGDVAASGGYWIATGAEQIVAQPGTITGSIGVVGLKPDLSGLLGKVGVKQETLKRGAKADLFSLARPWTAEERTALERHMASAYQLFLARVAEGRQRPVAEIEPLAQGRVWSGSQALSMQLVDRLGSLRDAVALARQRAGIPPGAEVEVRRMEAPRGLLEELDLGVVQEPQAWLAGLAARFPELRAAAALAELGPVVALPAEWLEPLAAPPAGASP